MGWSRISIILGACAGMGAAAADKDSGRKPAWGDSRASASVQVERVDRSSIGLAEKWTDDAAGVVCYVVGTANINGAFGNAISCVKK